ncbi:MAG: DUF1844 domain-containing protein [Planctomycetota bacterium]
MEIRKKRVDEDWKRRAEEEKSRISQVSAGAVGDAARAPARVPAASASSSSASPASTAPKAAPAAPPATAPTHEQLETAPDTGDVGGPSLIPVFEQLAAQAMAGLGQLPDPRTGARHLDLEMARYAIELLLSLEAKTRGRLDGQEAAVLQELVHSLRSAYAQISSSVAARLRKEVEGGKSK